MKTSKKMRDNNNKPIKCLLHIAEHEFLTEYKNPIKSALWWSNSNSQNELDNKLSEWSAHHTETKLSVNSVAMHAWLLRL